VLVVVLVVAAVVLVAAYLTWTAARIDQLHVRVDDAQASLEACLVRRAAAAQRLASSGVLTAAHAGPLDRAASAALEVPPVPAGLGREATENDLSRLLRTLPLDADPEAVMALREAVIKVSFARQFYNDAVRDTRALRARPVPRLLHLGGRRPLPTYFEIDDATLPAAVPEPRRP